MDEQVERLAQKIVKAAQHKRDGERLLVAVAGPPGSGKSTLVDPLLKRINEFESRNLEPAICVSLDGWHLYRHELDAMPDPKEAHWRRGAAFTFDHVKYLTFVKALRSTSPSIPFFLFDHAVKDPSPSPISVTPSHKIIIIEGLYTLLDQPGWREPAEMMDMKVWIEVDPEEARRRLIERNFEAGICGTREETAVRVDASDMVNGEMVREYRMEPTDIIVSVPTVKG